MDGSRRGPLRPWRRKAKITLFDFLAMVMAGRLIQGQFLLKLRVTNGLLRYDESL